MSPCLRQPLTASSTVPVWTAMPGPGTGGSWQLPPVTVMAGMGSRVRDMGCTLPPERSRRPRWRHVGGDSWSARGFDTRLRRYSPTGVGRLRRYSPTGWAAAPLLTPRRRGSARGVGGSDEGRPVGQGVQVHLPHLGHVFVRFSLVQPVVDTGGSTATSTVPGWITIEWAPMISPQLRITMGTIGTCACIAIWNGPFLKGNSRGVGERVPPARWRSNSRCAARRPQAPTARGPSGCSRDRCRRHPPGNLRARRRAVFEFLLGHPGEVLGPRRGRRRPVGSDG